MEQLELDFTTNHAWLEKYVQAQEKLGKYKEAVEEMERKHQDELLDLHNAHHKLFQELADLRQCCPHPKSHHRIERALIPMYHSQDYEIRTYCGICGQYIGSTPE